MPGGQLTARHNYKDGGPPSGHHLLKPHSSICQEFFVKQPAEKQIQTREKNHKTESATWAHNCWERQEQSGHSSSWDLLAWSQDTGSGLRKWVRAYSLGVLLPPSLFQPAAWSLWKRRLCWKEASNCFGLSILLLHPLQGADSPICCRSLLTQVALFLFLFFLKKTAIKQELWFPLNRSNTQCDESPGYYCVSMPHYVCRQLKVRWGCSNVTSWRMCIEAGRAELGGTVGNPIALLGEEYVQMHTCTPQKRK